MDIFLVVTCVSRIFFFSLNKSLHRGGVPLFTLFSSFLILFYFPIFSSNFPLLIPSSFYSTPSDKKHVLLSAFS